MSIENGGELTPLLLAHQPSEHQPKRETSIQSGLKSLVALPDMIIRSHAITKDGSIVECTNKDLNGAKSGNNKHYWIDIDANHYDCEDDDLRDWLEDLHLPRYCVDLLSPNQWASQVVTLQRALLLIVRILPENPTSNEVVFLAALQTRNLLLTFTSCPRSETGGLYAPACAQSKQRGLSAPTSSGALLAWLRFHVNRTLRSTRELRYSVLAMDEAMDRDITSVDIHELIAAKD